MEKHIVEITEIYCHTSLWQNFRESNVFTKENTKAKESVWRNFFE